MVLRFWDLVRRSRAQCSTAQTWWENHIIARLCMSCVQYVVCLQLLMKVSALTSFHTTGWTPCSWRSWAWSGDPPSAHTGSVWIWVSGIYTHGKHIQLPPVWFIIYEPETEDTLRIPQFPLNSNITTYNYNIVSFSGINIVNVVLNLRL